MRTLIIWLALGLGSLSVAADTKSCSTSILSQFWAHAVSFDEPSYRDKVNAWRVVLATKPFLPSALQRALTADSSLLNWVALHDAFLSDATPVSLFEVAKSLKDRGVSVTERRAVFESELSSTSKIRWLPMWTTKRVALYLPRKIPEPSDEWVVWLFHQLQSLENAFLAPLVLYRAHAIDAIAQSEFRLYEIGYQIQTLSGVPLQLPLQILQPYSPLREGLTYAWKSVFPSRSALRWQPQNQHFQQYIEYRSQSESAEASFSKVSASVRASYAARLRVYGVCQFYRSLLFVGGAGYAVVGTFQLVNALRSESWRAPAEAVQTLGTVATDASAREQAIRDYAESETGYEPVIQYYTQEVQALRQRQATESDPSGELEKEIQFKLKQMQELQR